VRVAGQDERAVGQVRQEEWRDVPVVVDQVAFRVAVFRPEDLLEARELEPPRSLGAGRRRRRRRLRASRRGDALLGPLLLAQAEEDGLAEKAVLGALLETHLADEPRLGPAVLASGRERPAAERLLHGCRLEDVVHAREESLREAAPDAPRVDERAFDVRPEMERPEPDARLLRERVADDHEVVRAIGAYLQPALRAAGPVGRVEVLRDDSLEAELDRRGEEL